MGWRAGQRGREEEEGGKRGKGTHVLGDHGCGAEVCEEGVVELDVATAQGVQVFNLFLVRSRDVREVFVWSQSFHQFSLFFFSFFFSHIRKRRNARRLTIILINIFIVGIFSVSEVIPLWRTHRDFEG